MSTNNHHSEVVMITGASAGIGRATARAFAKRGCKIGLFARGGDRLEVARGEVEAAGGRGLVLAGDISDDKAIENAAEQLEQEFGPIDIWVNNAMVSVFSPIAEMTPEEYRRVTEVTYLGYVWGTQTALRRMRPRNRGTIINVGSALAYRGIPLQSAYCAAKHAIHGFTEALRAELIHDKMKIRICEVEMPAVNTTQFDWVKSRMPNKPQPVPPIYQPEVAADAIVYAATHKRHEVYVGFPTVESIVANKLAPRLLDHYLGRKGYQSQQTDENDDPDRPNNLFNPLPGDFGSHGAFDGRARKFSLQLWLNKHRDLLAGAVLIPAAAIGCLLLLAKSKKAFRL